MTITKRDGTRVEFDVSKIKSAISKANDRSKEIPEDDIDRIVGIVEGKCNKYVGELTVETIQDMVEDTLLKSKYKVTAKQYILYRDQRTRIRQSKSKLIKEIGEKITASNIVNQNANIDELSFGGRKGEAANELMKEYALDYCMSEMARNNHLNNEIYIHR